MVHKDHI